MALVPDQKFSTFQAGGSPTTGDIIVGLRGGINTKFNWVLPAGIDAITGTANQVLVNGSFGVPVTGDVTLTLPQSIATTSSPAFNNVQLTGGIIGANGLGVLGISSVASATNLVTITNAPTTAEPGFNAIGSDTNIGLGYAAKGTGIHKFYTTGTIGAEFHTGTGYQRVSQFVFADVSAGYAYTFPQASGTIALVGGGTGVDSLQGTANQVLVNGTSGSPVMGAVILTTPQDIAATSNPTFNNLRLTGAIIGSNGFNVSSFSDVALATDYFNFSAGTVNAALMQLVSSQTNASFSIVGKGAGGVLVGSNSITSTTPFGMYNGTNKFEYFIPTWTANRTITLRDSSGTLAYLSDIPAGSPAALTKTDDTNVTLTLGGTPTTALLQATSLTLGWTGTLSGTRGGTGVNNGSSTFTMGGNVTFSGGFTFAGTITGNTAVTFPTSGTLATTAQLPSPAALTKTDDTNVTLTLGGTPSTALLQATSLTLGWTGQLAVSRGGTGISSFGTGVQTALGQNVTGSGGIVLATAPTLTQVTFSTTSGIIGTTTNDSAAAGSVGEFVTATVDPSSGVSMTTGAPITGISISLTAGDWDVWANVGFAGTGITTYTTMYAGISLTTNTLPAAVYDYSSWNGSAQVITALTGLSVVPQRVSVSSTTTVYLVAQSTFTDTFKVGGRLSARRRR